MLHSSSVSQGKLCKSYRGWYRAWLTGCWIPDKYQWIISSGMLYVRCSWHFYTVFGLFLKAIPFYFILDNGDLIFLAFGDFQNEVLSYNQFAVSRTLSSLKEMVQSATVILKHLFAITADTLTCSLTNFQGYYADRPMNLQIFLWCVNQQERTIFCKKKQNKLTLVFLCLSPVIDNEFCCNLPK